MVQESFIRLLENYTSEKRRTDELWNEIEINYCHKKRHYHNLTHLENLLQELLEIKANINDWDTVLFSLYYHDIIYNPLKTTNEEKSAEFAANRLQLILAPAPIIKGCVYQILATKKHAACEDSDTNYFTDADLSILGQQWKQYAEYYKNIRKEYSLYPDLIYVPARKKVLQHFLQMERIFKTDHFFKKFELQARENVQQELKELE
jgi:predicted metal-dependent HD superfamily phosphohydrolase